MGYITPIRPRIQLGLTLALFIAVSYVTQAYVDTLVQMVGEGWFGKILYVCITIIATVIAPVSSVPLIAVASGLWGWMSAAALSSIGWFIGAMIVFELSRSYGRDWVSGILSKRSKSALQRILPQRYNLTSLILLRMSVPVDALSYALGLFSDVDRKRYYIATAIGIVPFACVFAYFGMIDYRWQVVVLVLAIAVLWYYQRKKGE